LNFITAIDRYIFRLVLMPMLAIFVLAASLLVLDKMLRLFDFVATEGGPVGVVFKMLANLLPEYASLAIPLGLMLGILLAFRKLSISSELDVMRAVGLSYTRLLRVPEGDSAVVSSRVGATLDQRDNSFVPTDGWYAALGVEWARSVLSEEQEDGTTPLMHILKLTGTLNGYVPIDEVVIALQVRAGYIIPLQDGQTTFANRQFFLGGVDTLRGFNQDQLQPQDVADVIDPETTSTAIFRGSQFFYLLRAELRFPIYEAFHGAIFTDLGNHWAEPSTIVIDESFVRPTAGAGLRIVTPVGPLAIDVGFNLLQREALGEPLAAFHFSLGVF